MLSNHRIYPGLIAPSRPWGEHGSERTGSGSAPLVIGEVMMYFAIGTAAGRTWDEKQRDGGEREGGYEEIGRAHV